MTEKQRRWTLDELKSLFHHGVIPNLEKLIANPERKYRQEFAHSYAVDALRYIAESDVLPDDIRGQVLHILELHEKATDPFLGMNLSTEADSDVIQS
jgi:hypothetical protein